MGFNPMGGGMPAQAPSVGGRFNPVDMFNRIRQRNAGPPPTQYAPLDLARPQGPLPTQNIAQLMGGGQAPPLQPLPGAAPAQADPTGFPVEAPGQLQGFMPGLPPQIMRRMQALQQGPPGLFPGGGGIMQALQQRAMQQGPPGLFPGGGGIMQALQQRAMQQRAMQQGPGGIGGLRGLLGMFGGSR